MIGLVLNNIGNYIKEKKSVKKGNRIRIQTTIRSEIYYEIIKKYLPEYEHLNALLEEALILFDRYRKSVLEYGDRRDQLLVKLVREVGMSALGIVALEHLASGNPYKAIRENGLQYALEWYYNKPINKISLLEAIEAIKEIWLATNRVQNIYINKSDESIHLLFHSKLGPNSDKLLCEAIKVFLENNFNVTVEYKVFHHGYSIIIKQK